MLKLAQLPNRTPVKRNIAVMPDLDADLRDYLSLYHTTYGDKNATVEDIIPAILESFLASDRAFAKARKTAEAAT